MVTDAQGCSNSKKTQMLNGPVNVRGPVCTSRKVENVRFTVTSDKYDRTKQRIRTSSHVNASQQKGNISARNSGHFRGCYPARMTNFYADDVVFSWINKIFLKGTFRLIIAIYIIG